MWKKLGSLLNTNMKSRNISISKLIVNSKEITKDKDMTNAFNAHFTTIGKISKTELYHHKIILLRLLNHVRTSVRCFVKGWPTQCFKACSHDPIFIRHCFSSYKCWFTSVTSLNLSRDQIRKSDRVNWPLVWLLLSQLSLFSYSKAINFARACN